MLKQRNGSSTAGMPFDADNFPSLSLNEYANSDFILKDIVEAFWNEYSS